METLDQVVREALDEISPPRVTARPWEQVTGAERARRGSNRLRRSPRPRVVGLLVASGVLVLVVAGLILAWPSTESSKLSLLDRAEAAIGNGPVLHVKIESGFGATSIDLATGRRSFVHGEEELWFDPARGIRDLSLFRGVVQGDALYPSGRVEHLDKTLTFLAVGYRDALKNGAARVLADDVIDGRPVTWIRVDTQMLPDSSDGKLHEWAHDVAISKDTFKPVATRETRDGELSPDGVSRLTAVESLPAGSGDFSPPRSPVTGEAMSDAGTGSLTVSEATAVLGRTPLVPQSVAGLKLARIAEEVRRQGLDRSTGEWKTTHEGVTLYYGAASGGGIGEPPPSGDYVQVSETTAPDDQFGRGVRGYFPPQGELLTFGGHYGLMQQNGIYVSLEASREELLVAAARQIAG